MPHQFDRDVSWTGVQTAEVFEPLVKELADQRVFAWDVETNGISVWAGDHICGHGFAWRRPNGQVCSFYIPIRHQEPGESLFGAETQLPPEMVSAALKPVLEGPATKVGHNLVFDVHFAVADGIEVAGPVVDTMVGSRLVDETLVSYSLPSCLAAFRIPHERGWKNQVTEALKAIARRMRVKLTELRADHGYEYVPVSTISRYGCQDAAYELALGEYLLSPAGVSQYPSVWSMESELFWVCRDIQRTGVPLDTARLDQLAEECSTTMAELAPRIFRLAGAEFDITNDGQLRKILFERLGYPVISTTRNEVPQVNDDALWALETQHGCELAGLVRVYNSNEKILSTYTTSISGLVDRHNILHGEVRQSGTKTGRVSMARPNLQNIPSRTKLGRKVKEAFVTRPGMVRFCIDYSQIELRMLAHLSQDPLLLRVYREGLDAHANTAIEAFGTAGKVDGIDMRRIAKILNFGTSFCMTHVGLRKNINKDLPAGQEPISEAKAEEFLEKFYAKYQGIAAYRNSLWYQLRMQNGFFTNIYGRPRHLPAIDSTNKWARLAAERHAISTMVQGGAADLVKHAMVAVWKYLKYEAQTEAYMVLMVHDDLQIDAVIDGSAKVCRDVHRLMETSSPVRLSVPVVADVEFFDDHWNHKRELKLAS